MNIYFHIHCSCILLQQRKAWHANSHTDKRRNDMLHRPFKAHPIFIQSRLQTLITLKDRTQNHLMSAKNFNRYADIPTF